MKNKIEYAKPLDGIKISTSLGKTYLTKGQTNTKLSIFCIIIYVYIYIYIYIYIKNTLNY